jgi:succinoglycan biosynthesis protein ExoV
MLIHSLDIPNYGDRINRYLWERLLTPKLNDVAPEAVFYGIGSTLSDKMLPAARRVVFGAGYGGPNYGGVPKQDSSWRVYFVRGPGTSAALGGVPWIGDPAMLLSLWHERQPTRFPVSFMPHWKSRFDRGQLEAVGFHVIDPGAQVEIVIAEIAATGLLLTEALHGAITADTLRVPWIMVRSTEAHDFKWRDYCWSLEQVWNPIDMERFSLSWARDYAVPQLSALSILERRRQALFAAVNRLNDDIEGGKL